MRSLQPFLEPLFSVADVGCPGIVRAVCKPHGNIAAMQAAADLDAVFGVLESSFANRLIRIAKGAMFIILILEQVGIDRTRLYPVLFCQFRDFVRAINSFW